MRRSVFHLHLLAFLHVSERVAVPRLRPSLGAWEVFAWHEHLRAVSNSIWDNMIPHLASVTDVNEGLACCLHGHRASEMFTLGEAAFRQTAVRLTQ